MSSKRYTKRPIVIEALQWDGDLVVGKPEWFMSCAKLRGIVETGELGVTTNHGEVIAKNGDYIILSPSGEVYPCERKTFEMIYEAAPEMGGMSFEQAALSDPAVP